MLYSEHETKYNDILCLIVSMGRRMMCRKKWMRKNNLFV